MVRPQRVASASTSTGTPGTATFGTALQVAVAHVKNPTTGPLVWTMQGTIGSSTQWSNLNAATTSTGVAIVTSTATLTFDKVRINISGNAVSSTMGGSTYEWWIIAR